MSERSTIRRLLGASMLAAMAVSACIAAATQLQAGAPAQPAPYLPSISDMMIGTIQPRHTRLWIAAHAGNWDFSAYELGNLKGAFKRIGLAHPTVEGNAFPDLAAAVTQQPFADLDAAIKAKDRIAFDKGYSELTSACNACHQATNHGAVVIKVPDAASVADQDLAPMSQ